MELVSILIPTYNQEMFVRRAITSAQSQDYANLEIVISDDNSTDKTFEIIQEMAKSDSRIKATRNATNLGRLANYHSLIYDLAAGEFVINLDGDDEFLDWSYISKAINLIKQNPDMKLVFAKQLIRKPSGAMTEMKAKFPSVMDGNQLFLDYPTVPVGIPHLSALFHRKHAIERKVQETDTIASDTESLLRILPGIKVGFINEAVGAWTQHDSNQSGMPDIQKRISHFLMVTSPAEFLEKNQILTSEVLAKWKKKYLQRVLKENLIFLRSKGDLLKTQDFLRRARDQFGVQIRALDLLDAKFLLKFYLRVQRT